MKDNKSALVMSKPDNILDIINQKNGARKCSFDDIYPKLTHKSFLQKILNVIKNIQIELLSQVSTRKKNNQFSNKTILNLLKDLKIELSATLKENIQNESEIEHDTKIIKKDLAKKIFGQNEKNNKVKKHENKNPSNYQKLNSELSELKILNFKIENEIEYIDTKISIISSTKIINKNPSKNNYLFLEGRSIDSQPENILHNDLLKAREKFKFIVKKKDFQNKVILQLTTAVNLLKDDLKLQNKKNNQYIITNQIIDEETKEYPTKTTQIENEECYNNKTIFANVIENDILYKRKLICVNN
jgi:hypothetical protein